MRRFVRVAALVPAAIIALGLAYTGVKTYRHSQPEQCFACSRPIHAHARTVAVTNGHARLFCCPACALSEQHQEGKPIRVSELTSYLTGAKLSPDDAYLVKGSDVNMCTHVHEPMNSDKRTADILYDRCSPSLLAFAKRSEAVQFSREHGGKVLPFQEAARMFSQ